MIDGGTIGFDSILNNKEFKKSLANLQKSVDSIKKSLTVSVGLKLASGALSALSSSIKGAMSSAMSAAVYSVGEFSKEMKETIDTAREFGLGMDAAAEALKTSEITGMRVKDVIRQMSGGAKEIPEHMKKTSGEMRKNAENSIAWNKTISDVNDQFKRLGGQLLDVISPAFPYIVQGAQDIGDMIQDYVMPVIGKLSNLLVNLWADFDTGKRVFLSSVAAVEASFRATRNALALNAMDVLAGALEGVKSVFGSFQKAASETISWLDQQIRSLPIIGAAYVAAGDALSLAAGTVKEVGKGTVDAITNAAGVVTGTSGDIVKGFVADAAGIVTGVSAVSNVAKTAADAIESAWTSTYDSFQKNMDKANADYAADVKEASQNLGRLTAPPPRVKGWDKEVKRLTDLALSPKIEDEKKAKKDKTSIAGTFSGIAASQLAAQGPLEKVNKDQLSVLKKIESNLAAPDLSMKNIDIGAMITSLSKDPISIGLAPGSGVLQTQAPTIEPRLMPDAAGGLVERAMPGSREPGTDIESMFKALMSVITAGFSGLAEVNSGSLMRRSASGVSYQTIQPVQ